MGNTSREPRLGKISRLKELRVQAGLTQREFAELTGYSIPTISAWENGARFPKPHQQEDLAAALGVDESTLFDRDSGLTIMQSMTSLTDELEQIIALFDIKAEQIKAVANAAVALADALYALVPTIQEEEGGEE